MFWFLSLLLPQAKVLKILKQCNPYLTSFKFLKHLSVRTELLSVLMYIRERFKTIGYLACIVWLMFLISFFFLSVLVIPWRVKKKEEKNSDLMVFYFMQSCCWISVACVCVSLHNVRVVLYKTKCVSLSKNIMRCSRGPSVVPFW